MWKKFTLHNYRVIGGTGPMTNTTTPKDENLDPIKSCGIPQTVTQLKALLGATQQMAPQYVPYYALVAAPLDKLTQKDQAFPSGNKWIPGSDYDIAYHHIKSMILDRPLYLWNKDNKKHFYKLTCLAKILRGLYIGYPRLVHHNTRSKVFQFSIKKL